MIENILDKDELLAMIVRDGPYDYGVQFVTPSHLPQQVGYMRHPPGKVITPHVHNEVIREIHRTQEVLIIKKGKLKVTFFDEGRETLLSRELGAGDVIILIAGGHGFEVMEEVEMIEVKQGPYLGEADKNQFSP